MWAAVKKTLTGRQTSFVFITGRSASWGAAVTSGSGTQLVGSHQIRHTLATKLLNTGATLFEVPQLLRHADL